METHLKINHLAPYLPYGLKARNCFNEVVEIKGVQYGNESCRNELWVFVKDNIYLTGYLYECKPILRPLSDLTKEVEHNGKKFVFLSKIKESQHHLFFREDIENPLKGLQYSEMQKLLEWHFDVFGLIDKGLSVSYNDL